MSFLVALYIRYDVVPQSLPVLVFAAFRERTSLLQKYKLGKENEKRKGREISFSCGVKVMIGASKRDNWTHQESIRVLTSNEYWALVSYQDINKECVISRTGNVLQQIFSARYVCGFIHTRLYIYTLPYAHIQTYIRILRRFDCKGIIDIASILPNSY